MDVFTMGRPVYTAQGPSPGTAGLRAVGGPRAKHSEIGDDGGTEGLSGEVTSQGVQSHPP